MWIIQPHTLQIIYICFYINAHVDIWWKVRLMMATEDSWVYCKRKTAVHDQNSEPVSIRFLRFSWDWCLLFWHWESQHLTSDVLHASCSSVHGGRMSSADRLSEAPPVRMTVGSEVTLGYGYWKESSSRQRWLKNVCVGVFIAPHCPQHCYGLNGPRWIQLM